MPILLSTKEALGQVRRLLAMKRDNLCEFMNRGWQMVEEGSFDELVGQKRILWLCGLEKFTVSRSLALPRRRIFFGLLRVDKFDVINMYPDVSLECIDVVTRNCDGVSTSIMAEPLSPKHVFDFSADDPTLDLEDPDMELEEDPTEAISPVVASPPGLPPITPPPLSYSSSDSEFTAPVTANGALWVPPPGSTFETLYGSVRTLTRGMKNRQTEIVTTRTRVDRIRRRMDAFDVDLAFIEQGATRTSDDVLALQTHVETAEAKQLHAEQDRASNREEIRRLRRRLNVVEVKDTLTAMDRDRLEREFLSMRVWVSGFMSEVMGRGVVEARPSESIDVLAFYGDAQHSEPHGPPDGPSSLAFMFSSVGLLIMPPRRLRRRAVERLVTNRVAEAITEYERNQANPEGAGGAGVGNAGGGIAPEGNVTSSKPTTIHEVVTMARSLVDQAVRAIATRINDSNKRKWEGQQWGNNNNNNNRNNYHPHQQNQRQEVAKAYVAAPSEGRVPSQVQKMSENRRDYRNKCPKRKDQQNEGVRGRAYVMRTEEPQQNPNVVTSTFLLNDHYASILFDSSADKSFVSTPFTTFIDITPSAIDTSYEVELADRRVVSTNTVLCGCILNLLDHLFKIDLLPTELGTFDVILRMDWLSNLMAEIICYEKIIRIPLHDGEVLEVHGERPEKDPKHLSCMKTNEKKLEDFRVVRNFPKVFPDDLSGLPP
ncbi:putative reverse transcriptase domain-containing protein [Tanacetum coccineum]